jgi:1-aminocyclopropane-1-carboxylate deaminase/D-cysteine desulfhydrase-like pyridoxal-dependent ACC family enzyme
VIGAVGSAGRTVVKSVAFPVASAMAGAAAGMALKQRQTKRRKKVLGISIPGSGGNSNGLASNVGEAAKQLARLADEVRTGRQKAEEIGRALR